jgi:hypothetical protein
MESTVGRGRCTRRSPWLDPVSVHGVTFGFPMGLPMGLSTDAAGLAAPPYLYDRA